jgi:dihydroorotase
VVPMVTTTPAQMIGLSDRLGALTPGFAADISVLRDDRGRFVLRDNENTKVIAERLLQPEFCLRAGKRFDADSPILPQAIAA